MRRQQKSMCKLRNLTFDRAFSRISKLYIKVFYIPAVLSVDFNINFQCVKTVIFHKQVSFLELIDLMNVSINKLSKSVSYIIMVFISVVYEMGFDARRKDASWLTSLDHLASLDSLTSFTTLLSHSLYSTSLRFAPFRSWLPRANVKSHFIHYLPHPPYTLQVNIKSPFLYY